MWQTKPLRRFQACLTLCCLSVFRFGGKLHPEGGQGAGEGDGPEHRQVKVHRLPAGQQRRIHQSAETRRLQPHLRQQWVQTFYWRSVWKDSLFLTFRCQSCCSCCFVSQLTAVFDEIFKKEAASNTSFSEFFVNVRGILKALLVWMCLRKIFLMISYQTSTLWR